MTMVELLMAYAGAEVIYRREDSQLGGVALVFPGGRRMILLERTYRDGTHAILDPTDEELVALRETADLWTLWNSGRTTGVGGIGVTGEHLFD